MSTADSSTAETHQTAGTRFVDAGGVRFAYRRFGSPGPLPVVMLQHFRGNLDNWDPALTDAVAREREVILVDYPGVGSSSGEFGPAIAEWGIPDHGALQRLIAISCPTLIIQGDNDRRIPTKLFQYPQQVAADIGEFLDAPKEEIT